MTPEQEHEVVEGIRDLREALLGSLDGQQEGALHRINRLHEDFYHPTNPRESVHIRIKRLEDTENKRVGFLAALSVVGGAVGFAIASSVEWFTGGRK